MQWETYEADSGRGTGQERAFCLCLRSPEDLLIPGQTSRVLTELRQAGLSQALGVYFYRFTADGIPFLKIGECSRTEGISLRIARGWHYTTTCSDTYRGSRKKDAPERGSAFLSAVETISTENPAYFVFYQLRATHSFPKVDEMHAFKLHQRYFKRGTVNPDRMNTHRTLGSQLVFHRRAFREVLSKKLPSGTPYED
ncbi:hypothetical protein [Pseudomonas entomophila]|uniref:hypothetical protein n=1 Tax=Pseudomonas entomophila TaxID=312306 RepID=UPI001F00341C|nr:hypothetical protein [Pseudomonas entomophila]MCG8291720.1 hypothetical protein [Pseudomonas entomophila]